MTIPIQEVFTFPQKSRTLRVDDGQVDLGVGASFAATLLDDNGIVTVNCGRVRLTDMQYAAWTDDDTEVARMVARNIGLVPIVEVVPDV